MKGIDRHSELVLSTPLRLALLVLSVGAVSCLDHDEGALSSTDDACEASTAGWGVDPAHCTDRDADGAPDAVDLCPGTVPGSIAISSEGCSVVDLIAAPGLVADPVAQRLAERAAALDASPFFGSSAAGVDSVALEILGAADRSRFGHTCDGSRAFRNAAVRLRTIVESAAEAFLSAADSAYRATSESVGSSYLPGDVDPASSRWIRDQMTLDELDRDLGVVESVADAFSQACETLSDVESLEGVLRSSDDGGRVLELVSGERLSLSYAAGIDRGPSITGVQARVSGIRVGSTGLHAVQIGFGGPLPVESMSVPPPSQCLRLRVAPVQPMPLGTERWLLHPTEGYRTSQNWLQLEAGMRLGVEAVNCPEGWYDSDEGRYRNGYSLVLDLNYIDGNGDPQLWRNSASEAYRRLRASDPPLQLPSSIHSNFPATLTVTRQVLTCVRPGQDFRGIRCDNAYRTIGRESYQIYVSPHSIYCSIDLADDVLALDTYHPRSVGPTHVESFVSRIAGASHATFRAEAFAVAGDAWGTEITVGVGETFAVRRIDPTPLSNPRIEGERYGSTFRYSCPSPVVIRDAVGLCTGVPDSYYRLPFPFGRDVEVSQGNNTPWNVEPDASHSPASYQRYALDLRATLRMAAAMPSGATSQSSTRTARMRGTCTCVQDRHWLRRATGSFAALRSAR
jgi:hypothetical protein